MRKINREGLLEDIYKYYSMYYKEQMSNFKEIERLRQKKIKRKNSPEGERIQQDIINIAKGFELVDWTDNESCCYEYKILLHKNQSILDDDIKLMKALKGKRIDLRVFISILEPYYYMFVEETRYIETENKWEFKAIITYDNMMKELIKSISNYMNEKGFKRLQDNDVKMFVPNIETELKELNKANVFDCLFTDLVNLN